MAEKAKQNQLVFEFLDYKEYLKQALATSGKQRGLRSRLAHQLNCQTGFISQVLNGHVHFTAEHLIQINDFLGHTEEEGRYFMILFHYNRAGNEKLREFYLAQIQEIREKRQIIRNRIAVKNTISSEHQMIYYSSWLYAAIHILLSLPEYQNRMAVASYFKLPLLDASEKIDFLLKSGLIIEQDGILQISNTRIHLSKESPMLSRHHTNWRLRAAQSLDSVDKEALHYSSVICLSKKDAQRIKFIMLEALEKSEGILQESNVEAVYAVCMDLFSI
jgi:uncharacterized protein (TIGR02147 family)